MNARVSPFELPSVLRSPHPEAIALLRRALLLTVSPNQAQAALGVEDQDPLWPSALYHALARKKAFRRRPVHAPDAHHQDLGQVIAQLLAARQDGMSDEMARLALEVVERDRLGDPVLLRRIAQELDVWAYRRLVQLESNANKISTDSS